MGSYKISAVETDFDHGDTDEDECNDIDVVKILTCKPYVCKILSRPNEQSRTILGDKSASFDITKAK